MKWINGETAQSKTERLQDWHKWFAWFPVITGTITTPDCKTRHIKHWLCFVERKGEIRIGYNADCPYVGVKYWIFEYSEIEI